MSALGDGNPFGEAWRACLVEHYKAMAQDYPAGSRVMEQLDMVMDHVGFGVDDLRALLLAATLRADDVSDEVAAHAAQQAAHAHDHAAHDHAAHDHAPHAHTPDQAEGAPPAPAADAPQQMSLF